MQQTLQPPLQPAKPDCLVWYAGDPCDVLIQQYHQATELAQRKEWQVSVAAPLQKQIDDQQRLIKALQLQMAAQTNAALQGEARTDAIFQGIGAALGAALALIVALACFRRLARHTPAMKQEQEEAASCLQLAGVSACAPTPAVTACDSEHEAPVCSAYRP
jgi:hypothetical protein